MSLGAATILDVLNHFHFSSSQTACREVMMEAATASTTLVQPLYWTHGPLELLFTQFAAICLFAFV